MQAPPTSRSLPPAAGGCKLGGRTFAAVYDASEAREGKSSDELMHEALQGDRAAHRPDRHQRRPAAQLLRRLLGHLSRLLRRGRPTTRRAIPQHPRHRDRRPQAAVARTDTAPTTTGSRRRPRLLHAPSICGPPAGHVRPAACAPSSPTVTCCRRAGQAPSLELVDGLAPPPQATRHVPRRALGHRLDHYRRPRLRGRPQRGRRTAATCGCRGRRPRVRPRLRRRQPRLPRRPSGHWSTRDAGSAPGVERAIATDRSGSTPAFVRARTTASCSSTASGRARFGRDEVRAYRYLDDFVDALTGRDRHGWHSPRSCAVSAAYWVRTATTAALALRDGESAAGRCFARSAAEEFTRRPLRDGARSSNSSRTDSADARLGTIVLTWTPTSWSAVRPTARSSAMPARKRSSSSSPHSGTCSEKPGKTRPGGRPGRATPR